MSVTCTSAERRGTERYILSVVRGHSKSRNEKMRNGKWENGKKVHCIADILLLQSSRESQCPCIERSSLPDSSVGTKGVCNSIVSLSAS